MVHPFIHNCWLKKNFFIGATVNIKILNKFYAIEMFV